MGKEVKERRSHTLTSQSKPAMNFRTLLESGYFHDLLFLANKASAILFGEVVVVAPEESLTGRVEKHACKFKRFQVLVTQSETEAEEDGEAKNTISEAALNQAVLGSDVPGGEMIVSESEDFIPLLDEAGVEEEKEKEKEKEKGVSNASRCNQWWNFKTRPRTSKGIRRHVRWSKKRKRNCMTFEETQSNRKILLLAVEAVTHQLGLLDVSMEEKSSHK
ncbi:hypothetical protein Bca101_065412 [Brassica carinata]